MPELQPPTAAPGGNGQERSARGPDVPIGRYEPTDVSARAMVRWAVGLIVFTLASMVLMLAYYAVLRGPLGPQKVQAAEQRLPPWPRLQSNPARDIAEYQEEQRRLATTYGWQDRQRGIVRMPVDQAMEIVLRRGLPSWGGEKTSGEKR